MNLLNADDFHSPSIGEFFPNAIFFEGTIFELNRIALIRILICLVVVIWLIVASGRLKLIPSKAQLVFEWLYDFVYSNIAKDMLGVKDARRFMPILLSIFIAVLAFNITGIIPFLNIAASSTVGFPLTLAVVSYIMFIYAGIKAHGAGYFKNALFPPGVPGAMYILVTPIEFISTFIIRPVSLTLRLLMNMVAGHLILVLCFSATWFLAFSAETYLKGFSVLTFAGGFAFTLFEILVAALQAYIFTLLSCAYLQSSLSHEH